jgi:hypothetical protein
MDEKEKRTRRDFDKLLAEGAHEHAVHGGFFAFLGVLVGFLSWVLSTVYPDRWLTVLLVALCLLGAAFLSRLDRTIEALPPGVREEQKAGWTRLFKRVLSVGGGVILCFVCLALFEFGYGAIVLLGALVLVVAQIVRRIQKRREEEKTRQEWERDCLHWHGRLLSGEYWHWCYAYNGLAFPIDETTPEFACCHCVPSEVKEAVLGMPPSKQESDCEALRIDWYERGRKGAEKTAQEATEIVNVSPTPSPPTTTGAGGATPGALDLWLKEVDRVYRETFRGSRNIQTPLGKKRNSVATGEKVAQEPPRGDSLT